MKRLVLFALLCVAPISTHLHTQTAPGSSAKDSQTVDLLWGIKIPMRDGILLNATIYKPGTTRTPLPVVFTLTPYISDTYHERGYFFPKHGYVYAIIDVRGRGNSGGTFTPFLQEAKDGYDIVEWLARQPWCNGKVAMWGGSYAGHNQWATAKEFPPHLRTIVPAAAAFMGADFPIWKNVKSPYALQWLTYTSGLTPNSRLYNEDPFWIQKFREMYLLHLPFSKLDSIVGNQTTVFQTWVAHPMQDAYWDAMNPSNNEFSKINLPILTITGHYDAEQAGAMEFYHRHMANAPLEARAKHYLIIGPWNHAGTRTPDREVGGLTFGNASMVDLKKLHVEWYDWIMKEGKRPEFLKKRVAYYVVGEEKWKYADALESISKETKTLYLHSDGGRANDAFQSGSLGEAVPGKEIPDSYVYDPLDIRPAELEKEEIKNYITDQRYALNLFGNGVIYHSGPFAESTEVTGYVKLTAWIALDVPDADFDASLYEIMPNGTSVMLTQDRLRARYRESPRREQLVTPGAILHYEFNGFTFFSRQIAKGSRLRLVINCPNSIFVEKNYMSGGVVANETAKDARKAHVKIYHDNKHTSALILPIVR